jgi:hypothetical protein
VFIRPFTRSTREDCYNYFRINPFTQEFSQFLNQLMHDPGIANKSLKKRTDSSLFSFMAEYKNFSPYTFLADRTEIRFFEKAFDIGDSTILLDTVLIYQLMGFSNGKDGLDIVKKEFDRFHKRFQKQFVDVQSSDLKKNDEVVGGIINYFVFGTTISPLSISWLNWMPIKMRFRFYSVSKWKKTSLCYQYLRTPANSWVLLPVSL